MGLIGLIIYNLYLKYNCLFYLHMIFTPFYISNADFKLYIKTI